MQIRSLGIDLGKTTFHLVALGVSGKALVKKKFRQKQLLAFTANIADRADRPRSALGSPFPQAIPEATGPRRNRAYLRVRAIEHSPNPSNHVSDRSALKSVDQPEVKILFYSYKDKGQN